MTLDLRISPVRESDAPEIVELLNQIVRTRRHSAMAEETTVEDQLAFLRNLPAHAMYWAARDVDGSLLGIQDVLPGTPPSHGEISTFIAEAARRRGVGAALMGATLEAAESLGYVMLVATIREDNAAARSYYRASGFREIEALRNYAQIDGRALDGVRAVREIA